MARDTVPTTPDAVLGPPVYVIGGGPGGLAVAAALRARGVRAVVLEKAPTVAAGWRRHYDRLRLHTTRRRSALPGLRLPRAFGRWVARDDLVRYLEKYAETHDLEVVTGVEVLRIERAPAAGGADGAPGGDADGGADGAPVQTSGGTPGAAGAGDRWVLHATGGRRLTSRAVVVATGAAHTPRVPRWPGVDAWEGKLLHSAAYRSPAPYAGRDVLVVGAGNSGAEIAVDLVEGGAARVRLAVRTAPHLVRRSVLGWPAQATGVLVRRLPVWPADRLLRLLQRLTVPDLSAYGLPRPADGPYARLRRDGAVPVYDTGLIDAVRRGRVEPVAAVASFGPGKVTLADGSVADPDTVIAATGYDRALEPLVGHLGVLDEEGRPVVRGGRTAQGAPGLYFAGYTHPLSGLLREVAREARRIAKAVAAVPQPPAPYGVHGPHGPAAPGRTRRRGRRGADTGPAVGAGTRTGAGTGAGAGGREDDRPAVLPPGLMPPVSLPR
ncbi:flavin-containing monooxygenase [Streptomyces kanasensis]|uniref:flavin-containing monooxygenase n=1 Tax=Streptomyces kanasensis TaxID=936756 RepID=UPI0037FE86E8